MRRTIAAVAMVLLVATILEASVNVRHVVISKATKQVLRHGYTDFENQPEFDPEAEEVILMDFEFVPDMPLQDWWWHEADQTFKTEAP